LKELLEEETDAKEIFLELSARDVEAALELLAKVHEKDAQDGFVSWEVDPTLAYDREATFAEAMRLHAWLDKPNLYVKIPATKPGLGAIEDSIAHGKSINVTLIFSLQRYREVVEAYLRGLERLVASGGDPSNVHSVASFFVSRVDTEADKRLEAIGTTAALALRGKLAIANAKLAYAHYQEAFGDERWAFLEAKGATKQRCLWASTSTKNPEYRDVIYVEELIGPDTVDTMPLETVAAFQDHGQVRGDTVMENVAAAHTLVQELAEAGVDYDDVTETLELEGVQKFADSFEELLDGVRAKRGALAAA
jgi:transaldolase